MPSKLEDFFPRYLPASTEPEGVLIWGKPPELRAPDTAAGVARLDGERGVNYSKAYLLGAETLFKAAQLGDSLDHHGLPIFYLQRHATELMSKGMLLLAIEIEDLRAQTGKNHPAFPNSNDQRKRASTSHKLSELLNDLSEMAEAMDIGPIPHELTKAVVEIESVEGQSETWSRYSASRTKDGKARRHLEIEVILPLGHLQGLLQVASTTIGEIWSAKGMLGQLGEMHQDAARNAGLID